METKSALRIIMINVLFLMLVHWQLENSAFGPDPDCLLFIKSLSSVAQLCPTFCNPKDCSTPGFPAHHQLPKLAQIHVHWKGDDIQPSHPLLSLSPSAFNLSQHQGLFHWGSWPKYWSFSFTISPSSEYSGLISFRTDWFDLFAVQGTLRSLLQPHSLKASILQCSAFLMVQLSHSYMTMELHNSAFSVGGDIFARTHTFVLEL